MSWSAEPLPVCSCSCMCVCLCDRVHLYFLLSVVWKWSAPGSSRPFLHPAKLCWSVPLDTGVDLTNRLSGIMRVWSGCSEITSTNAYYAGMGWLLIIRHRNHCKVSPASYMSLCHCYISQNSTGLGFKNLPSDNQLWHSPHFIPQ